MNKKAPFLRLMQHASSVILLLLSVFSLPAHQFIEHGDAHASLTPQKHVHAHPHQHAHKHHNCGHRHNQPEPENSDDHEDCDLCQVLSLHNCQVNAPLKPTSHTRLIEYYCSRIKLQQGSQHYSIESSSRGPPKVS